MSHNFFSYTYSTRYLNKSINSLFVILIFLVLITTLFFSNQKSYSQTILKGSIRTVLEKGTLIKVNLSTPINFYYSQIGDKVGAFTKEDILIGDDFYIPKESRIVGIITNIMKPKHFGQNGAFEIDFTEIITKDNISIPIYASVTTDTKNIEEKFVDVLTYDSALIAYGTFHGAIAGLQYGGIPLAIASHGISVLTGAGIGTSFGIIGSLVRKGDIPTVLTGEYIPIVLKSDLYVLGNLPRFKKEEGLNEEQKTKNEEYKGFRFFPVLKGEEVELVIKNIRNTHSHLYGNYITIEFNLKNNSQKRISLSDIVLVNELEAVSLHPDLFLSGQEVLKTAEPLNEITASLAFLITNKKENYSLAILDPLDRTEIVKIPLNKYFDEKNN